MVAPKKFPSFRALLTVQGLRSLLSDSLVRNSFWLLIAQGVTLLSGFLFWLVLARFYTEAQVGIGATLIAAAGLLMVVCSLGLDSALVRFLPKIKDQSALAGSVLVSMSALAVIGSILFIVGTPLWSKQLVFLHQHALQALIFILGVVVISLFTAIEGVFVSHGDSHFLLGRNVLSGIAKILLAFALVAFGGLGVFGAHALASAIGVGFLLLVLVRRYGYSYIPQLHVATIRRIAPYSLSIYVSGLAGSLPVLLLPLIVTAVLGPESTAYYYLAMQIANLVLMVPLAVTQSLFAEGSRRENEAQALAKKSLRTTWLVLIPLVAVLVLLAKYVLLIFGASYSDAGARLLALLAVSGFAFTYNVVCGTVLRVQFRMRAFLAMTVIGTVIVLGLTAALLRYGLLGVGLGWLVGQCIISCIYLLVFHRSIFGKPSQPTEN